MALAAVGFHYARGQRVSSSLRVDYGERGIERLAYQGVALEDLEKDPSDAFHIWHLSMTGLDGRPRSEGQYGWGENHSERRWDGLTHTWTYRFTWGTIAVGFVQSGDQLDMKVTEQNDAGSGVILEGATIYPLALHLPRVPQNFGDAATAHVGFNGDAPGVTVADYGKGEVAVVVPEADKPLYSGFLPTGQPRTYTPVISGTAPGETVVFPSHRDGNIKPGQSESFTVSLRFAPSGTASESIAGDAYSNWQKTWPAQLHWPDRRMIGTIYLASSPSSGGDASRPGGFPNNPRRYFNNGAPEEFDLRTPGGLSRFQLRVLRQARDSVDVLRRLHAQGAVTWDIEGEQYPQETSYVCAPDQIASLAPEMESVVSNPASPYSDMKLDDAYFKIFRDAGFRVGVCVRPQRFTRSPDGTARQVSLPDDEAAAELVRKMRYAHDRWGATLFYLDSMVGKTGSTLDAAILQKAAAALPDSLLIPEQSMVKSYAYAAPFKSFLFHEDLGTDATVRRLFPQAFSVNLINDVDAAKLATARDALTESVRRGDILMGHADYWQANNPLLVQMYEDAGQPR